MAQAPDIELARRVLPAGLFRALSHLFMGNAQGVMLVGGTALAGFYAGHRRSDDIDLFVRDELDFAEMNLAVASLENIGARLTAHHSSPHVSRVLAELNEHTFTIDVVRDPNIFRVGRGVTAGGIVVADLETLTMCKAATLVSRCSEKDLYDLFWLCSHGEALTPAKLVELGSQIDAGVHPESILMCLLGASPSRAACDFALPAGANQSELFETITRFRAELQRAFTDYLEELPVPPLGHLLRRAKRRR